MSGSGAESRNATIKEIVGAYCSRYPMDKSGACSRGGGGEEDMEESKVDGEGECERK